MGAISQKSAEFLIRSRLADAERGNVDALFELGVIYSTGRGGVPVDLDRSAQMVQSRSSVGLHSRTAMPRRDRDRDDGSRDRRGPAPGAFLARLAPALRRLSLLRCGCGAAAAGRSDSCCFKTVTTRLFCSQVASWAMAVVGRSRPQLTICSCCGGTPEAIR